MLQKPILTIITISYNSSKTLPTTIKSIIPLLEKYPQFEYLIKDGLSNDSSFEIAQKLTKDIENVSILQSRDEGIYSAMNEALLYSKGKYILYINSDDFLLPSSFDDFFINILNNDYEYIAAPIIYFKRPSLKIRRVFEIASNKSEKGFLKNFIFSPYPGHPGFICKKELILKYFFDEKYQVSADYFLMQQIVLDSSNKKFILKKPISAMALGGASLKIKGIETGYQDIRLINKFLGFNESIYVRYVRNLIQFLLALFSKYKIQEEFLNEINEFNKSKI